MNAILREDIQKVGLALKKIVVVEHAHDRAGRYELPAEGTMHILLQTGVKNGVSIAHPRGCVKLSNGYYAIIELFEKDGVVEGKVLTCLSEYQLATSRNMHFGDHYKVGFAYKAEKVEEVENCFYGCGWKSMLMGHPVTSGEMHRNAVEVKFSEASTLQYAGYKYEGRPNGNKMSYYKLHTKKVIVVCP